MTHLYVVDLICVWTAILLPAGIILGCRPQRTPWMPVLAGTLIAWLAVLMAGPLLSVLGASRPGGRLLDLIWLLGGWLPSLLYAGALYLLRQLIHLLIRLFRVHCGRGDG